MKDFDQYISSNNLHALIAEGEHEQQDFKYKISDARKIARTLSAFSNTSGGKLLVGVRDNGVIAGVKDEDDIYLLESAARVFSIPEIELVVKAHAIEGKLVWEVDVPEGLKKPYKVDEVEGHKSYIRIHDQNMIANAVLVEMWRQEQSNDSKRPVQFSEREQRLIQYLKDYERISTSKAAKLMQCPRNKAVNTLARLIRWEVIDWDIEGGQFYCTLL